MEKLRLVSYAKEIEVNDNGDTIILQVEDQSIYHKLKKLGKTLEDKANEIKSLNPETDIEIIIDKLYEMDCYAKAAIDDIFGEGTCKKVYVGDIVPPVERHIEFIKQITPYFEEYAKERVQRLEKYNPDRVGSSI